MVYNGIMSEPILPTDPHTNQTAAQTTNEHIEEYVEEWGDESEGDQVLYDLSDTSIEVPDYWRQLPTLPPKQRVKLALSHIADSLAEVMPRTVARLEEACEDVLPARMYGKPVLVYQIVTDLEEDDDDMKEYNFYEGGLPIGHALSEADSQPPLLVPADLVASWSAVPHQLRQFYEHVHNGFTTMNGVYGPLPLQEWGRYIDTDWLSDEEKTLPEATAYYTTDDDGNSTGLILDGNLKGQGVSFVHDDDEQFAQVDFWQELDQYMATMITGEE